MLLSKILIMVFVADSPKECFKTVLAQFSNDATNAVSTEIHNRTVDELKISVPRLDEFALEDHTYSPTN